jgi:hypothetical protein
MKKLKSFTGSNIRLLLAAALCAAVLVASSDSGACSDYGKIRVTNHSDFIANVSFSGPESTSCTLAGQASTTLAVKVGTYGWTAIPTGIVGGQADSGSCIVKKDTTTTVDINF